MMQVTARPLVLLVEDHADTRQMYAEFLGASFDVLEAADGQEALDILRDQMPALVITDFSLPGIDGFELTRQMRSSPATGRIPVICLSGYGGHDHERRAREVGCDRVLEKPCLPDLLARTAHEVVSGSES
jgi:two-component system, cell cycle response regulator DivK